MAAPLDVFPPSADATPDALLAGVSGKAIEGRSLGQIAWMRLRRDKVAMGGGIVVVFLILVAIIGPHLVQSPNTYHSDLINPTFLRPNGAFGGVSLAHPLGVEPETALRKANAKFSRRFTAMETAIGESGRTMKDMSLEELEKEWQRVKQT